MSNDRDSYRFRLKEQNAKLIAENRELRKELAAKNDPLRSWLEDAIRAQRNLEIIDRLISEIRPNVFCRSVQEGREILYDLECACDKIRRMIDAELQGLKIKGQKPTDEEIVGRLAVELIKMATEGLEDEELIEMD